MIRRPPRSTLDRSSAASDVYKRQKEGIAGTWSPATIDNTKDGVYTFTPSGNTCAATGTLTVTVTKKVTATLVAVDPTCTTPTGSITVSSSTTGLEFSLDGGAYGPYPASGWSGLAAGPHTIKVRNAAGCETTLTQAIATAPSAPTATLVAVDPTCTTPTGSITVSY